MKTVSSLLCALFAGALLPSTAEAGQHRRSPAVKKPAPAAVRGPVYTGTRVIACRTECRWAKDECGRRWSYEVNVTTYADFYSDGSRKTYTRTTRV